MARTISRILVPTDFGPTSEAALDYAKAIAARFGASLHLLHVIEDRYAPGTWGAEAYITSMPAMQAALIDAAAGRLARMLGPAERELIAARSEVRVGRAADAIREVAEHERCDLIVMGTHGRSGVAHLLLGSVAEKMLREAPCPVLTVRGDAAGALQTERDYAAHPVPIAS